MSEKELNISIETRHTYLLRNEKIDHWLNFASLLVPLGFIGYLGSFAEIKIEENFIYVFLLIGAFILLLKHKLECTKLIVYNTELTGEQFKEASQATAKLNGWRVISNRENYFQAIQEVNWQWDGIKITALLNNGKLYLNSMSNPSISSNPFTFGFNKKNKMELIRNYQYLLKGNDVAVLVDSNIDENEEKFWNESELSPKNLAMKLVGYSLGLSFIVMSSWMMSSLKITNVLFGIIIVLYAGKYFYYDWKVILEKRKRNQQKNSQFDSSASRE